jgi:TadE-like protein.
MIAFAGVAVLLFLFSFGGVQAAMWYHARNVCQSAAQVGVQAARALGAPPGAGAAAARAYIARAGHDTVHQIDISQTGTGQTVTVTCRGRADGIIPITALSTVDQSATMPIERWQTP